MIQKKVSCLHLYPFYVLALFPNSPQRGKAGQTKVL